MKFPISLFNQVLNEFPKAIIAGGAIRDAVLGKEIGDIDIWGDIDLPDIFESDNQAGEYTEDGKENSTKVQVVIKVKRAYCPYVINIIKLYWSDTNITKDFTIRDVVNRFDYDICKAGYSLKEGLILTPEFIRDVSLRRMTHSGCQYTKQARYLKLMSKFPGWHIDAPSNPLTTSS